MTFAEVPEPRPTFRVIEEIAEEIKARPRYRLHCAPGAERYVEVSLGHAGLSRDAVVVVEDPRLLFGEAWTERA